VIALNGKQNIQLLWLGADKDIRTLGFSVGKHLPVLLLWQATVHVDAAQQTAGGIMTGELDIRIWK